MKHNLAVLGFTDDTTLITDAKFNQQNLLNKLHLYSKWAQLEFTRKKHEHGMDVGRQQTTQ